MKIPKLKLNQKSIKVKIDKEVCNHILKNNFISKKDLGHFTSELLLQQRDLELSIKRFLEKKYSLDKITDYLARANKNEISFNEVRIMLNISKRMFYPRLRVIKKYFINSPNFEWSLKRGRFVRPKPTLSTKKNPEILYQNKRYLIRLASNNEEKDEAFKLRYNVFHDELHEAPYNKNQVEKDKYDDDCDHLIIEHKKAKKIVATERILPWYKVVPEIGFYSEQEFKLTKFPKNNIAELGRLCVDKDYRETNCFISLWLAQYRYAIKRRINYFFGCTSLKSNTSVSDLGKIYSYLQKNNHISKVFDAEPKTQNENLKSDILISKEEFTKMVPKMVNNYIRIGGFFVGKPCYDNVFKVYDLLTIGEVKTFKTKSVTSYLTLKNHLKTAFLKS